MYVLCPEKTTKLLASALTLGEISVPQNSVFFAHRYRFHAGRGWRKTHDLCRHVQLIPWHYVSKDTIGIAHRVNFSYRPSLSLNVKASGSVH